MKVSVIIPVYNAEAFLHECLDSVVGQTLEDIEILCVDDGSVDGSQSILREYAAADSRVKVIEQVNGGGGAARNAALRVAQGEYLAFLDADDYFEPEMLAHMSGAADEQAADIVLCRSYTFDSTIKVRAPFDNAIQYIEPNQVFSADEVWEYAFRFSVGWPWDKMFRRSFVEKHALTFQELRSTNDAYFVFIGLALADRMVLVDEYLVTHRIGNVSSIENTREKSWDNSLRAVEAIGERLREEGLYEKAEQSYLNWIADFTLWNYRTLTGEAKKAYALLMREIIVPNMASLSEESYYRPAEYSYMLIAGMSENELVITALAEHQKVDDLSFETEWRRDESDRLRNENNVLVAERAGLNAQIGILTRETEALQREREALELRKRELEESTAFKLGRVVTYLPRKIKGLF